MNAWESYRKSCLKRQTELRHIMMDSKRHDEAIQQFLIQHTLLHSSKMAQTGLWSFEDAIFADISGEQIRTIPRNCIHSIAWLIWHIARCEDIAMNLLVAGSPQILQRDNWLEKTKATIRDTGNAMNEDEIRKFNRRIDIAGLRAYRMAVGRRTREIAGLLQPTELKQIVDPSRLQKVRDEGAVVEAASGIIDYWGKRDVAGLLLMPATRHNLVHLNEANQIKGKMK